jgi:hypothetical protein
MQFLKHLHGHASGGGEHHGRRTTVYPFDGRNNQRMNWAFCPAQIRTRRTHVDKIRETEEQQDNSQKKKKKRHGNAGKIQVTWLHDRAGK